MANIVYKAWRARWAGQGRGYLPAPPTLRPGSPGGMKLAANPQGWLVENRYL
ncbi:hypothetical protein HC928_16215 [bacterium]|nr:hypothetical protein [bacterium]